MEAFKDSIVFNNLYTENHVENKFFTCPFIADFPIGSMLEIKTPAKSKQSRGGGPKSQKSRRSVNEVKTPGRTTVGGEPNSVVDDFLEQIEQQRLAKLDPIDGLDPEFKWISVTALILIGCLKCAGLDS